MRSTLLRATPGSEKTNRGDGRAEGQRRSEDFGAVYDRHAPGVYRYLFSRCGDPEVAKDLTSQTFLTAFEAYPRYQEKGYTSAWLFSIARNKYVDHVRQAVRQKRFNATSNVDAGQDWLGQAIASERVTALRELIHTLPEASQELLRLRYVADLSFAEMASLLKRNEDTVKKSLYRLLADLQRRMEA